VSFAYDPLSEHTVPVTAKDTLRPSALRDNLGRTLGQPRDEARAGLGLVGMAQRG